jgi:acetoacetate decarboxylase
MAKIRYAKTLEQVKKAAESNPEFLSSTVRSVRCVYETDASIIAAITPKPLEPAERPEICVTFSHVAMHITPEYTFEIGSAIFGTRVSYDGVPGTYLVTMPMTTEQAVVPGRETYGEPKKIAEIAFSQENDAVTSSVTRMGVPYLEVQGTLGESKGPRSFIEHAYCYKAFPSCEQGGTFDSDPLLVRLEWQHEHSEVREVENGELILRESMFDPVADIPVKKLVSMEYEVGSTQSNGKVLRAIPGEWLMPYLHQRYDDSSGDGVEI